MQLNLYKDDIKKILSLISFEKDLGIMDKKMLFVRFIFRIQWMHLNTQDFLLFFEELFLIQLKLIRLRENTAKTHLHTLCMLQKTDWYSNLLKSLPFELTSGQKQAVNEILQDMNSDVPMQRLLQGDVGSGKTVVVKQLCCLQ